MNIQFTPRNPVMAEACPKPQPASHFMEDWYRALPKEMTGDGGECPVFNNDGKPSRTVKACKPFIDALGMGYIIPLPVDVHVMPDPNRPDEGPLRHNMQFHWGEGGAWASHGHEQVEGMSRYLHNPGKWMNPWTVKTPRGYSCLLTHPLNRADLPFRILSGVVDTDQYHNEVNFPFDWTDPDFDGILKAGTPMAQVIPFRRESWRGKVNPWSKKHAMEMEKTKFSINATLKDAYAKLFWSPKRWL